MKILNYKNLLIPAAFVFALGLSPALAAEDAPKTGASIDNSVLQLGTIKDDNQLSPEEKLNKEIEARTKIISEALSLSLEEIESVNGKLSQLPKFSDKSREKELQESFVADLDKYVSYFEDQTKKLEDLETESDKNKLNDGLRDLAKELKDYRDNNYNPTIQKTIEFALLFYDESAVSTAKTRLGKITADIKKLEKLGLIERGAFKNQLDKASKLIASASDLQSQAKELIINPVPDDEDENVIEASETPDAKEKIVKPKPRELIEESLSNIKSAYDIFLKISKDVRKALGIK